MTASKFYSCFKASFYYTIYNSTYNLVFISSLGLNILKTMTRSAKFLIACSFLLCKWSQLQQRFMIQSGKFPWLFVKKTQKIQEKNDVLQNIQFIHQVQNARRKHQRKKIAATIFWIEIFAKWLNKNLYNLVFLVVFVFQFRKALNWVTFKEEKTKTGKTLFGFKHQNYWLNQQQQS